MYRLLSIVFAAMAALTAMAQATPDDVYSRYYENLPIDVQQVNAFDVPAHEMKLTDFGAVGDGKTVNTEAFARAISALTKLGGGTLVVPQGIFMTGPIVLKDNIRLHLERGAVVMASEDKRLFLNKDPKARVRPLVSASKRRNIMITGEGCIDGNGAQWRPVKRQKVSDVEWKQFLKMGGTTTDEGQLWFPFNLKHAENIADTPEAQENMRADLVRLTDCQNVLLQGVTFQNSPRFHVHPVRCQNVVVDGITVRCPWNAQNGDAIDLSNCQRVLLVNSIVDAGDDGICMKGGSGESGLADGPCRDILIQDNTVYHAHGGFVIGSDVSGGMNRIVVRRCLFSGTDTGLRFKSGIGRGGKTENIFISDIVMTDITQQAIVFECTYVDRKYAVNTKEEGEIKTQGAFAPDFRDIHISDVVCHNVPVAIKAVGLPDMQCVSDIHITNSHFTYSGKACDIDPHCLLDIEQTTFTKLGSAKGGESATASQENSLSKLLAMQGNMTEEQKAYARANWLVAPKVYVNRHDHPSSYVISPNPAPDTQPSCECSGCSSAYLLRFYGERVNGVELFNQPSFPCKHSEGAYPKCFKVLFEEQYGNYTTEYYTGTTDDLKNAVSKGIPVIVLLFNGKTLHYVPVVGYDKDHFFIQDSVDEYRNVDDGDNFNRSVEIPVFDKMWNIPIESCQRLFVIVRKK